VIEVSYVGRVFSAMSFANRILLLLTLRLFAKGAVVTRAVSSSQQAPSSAQEAAAAAVEAKQAAAQRAKLKAQSVSTVADLHVHDVQLRLGQKDDWHPFEGVGALSAGASSRLLLDYPKEQRGEILDLLFKPKYGASLQVLKIEIGGDMQSTDGSEPSHMRFKGEKADCSRGYETWLMKEAKARNPKVRTYALAWGVPGWIGNGNFFSNDNIVYHVSFLTCIRDTYGFEVDYIGVWNEMPWGQVWYVDELVQAMAAAKLKTRLVLLDSVHGVDQGFLDLFTANATFRNMVDAVGTHYPCKGDDKLMTALKLRKQTRFWSSEELSTVADWGGAGCWGRMINQNYIRMNATSSIAWSLVWSAYPNLECFGNGLLYAFEPWSGHFGVMPPVWTSAHTTQFTEAGWHYLAVGDGAGLLPDGGTYVTTVSEDVKDFTLVLETLQGQCFYRGGCFHDKEANGPQKVRFELGKVVANKNSLASIAKARGSSLEVWMTNKTHLFQRQNDVRVDADGSVLIEVPADSMITLSTLRGASKQGSRGLLEEITSSLLVDEFDGVAGKHDAPSAPFPLPYSENFDEYTEIQMPRFFADQGGAFEVIEDAVPDTKHVSLPKGVKPLKRFHSNRVLEQRVDRPPIAWIGHSPEPLTLFGDVNWTDISAEATVRLGVPSKANKSTVVAFSAAPPAPRHAGVCVRLSRYHFFGSGAPEGYCLRIVDAPAPAWMLLAAGAKLASGALPAGAAERLVSDGWVHLRLEAQGARLKAFVEGEEVANLIDTSLPFGQVALECGYHRCQLDDIKVSPVMQPALIASGDAEQNSFAEAVSHRTLVRKVELSHFVYNERSCDPAPRMAPRRRDFTGLVGFSFEPKRPVLMKGLGRLRVSGGHPWAKVHKVSLFEEHKDVPIVSVALPTDDTSQVGIEETNDGWVFAALREPVRLNPGTVYLLVSSELANGDSFYDKAVRVGIDDDVTVKGPVYLDNSGWHQYDEPNKVYGPLNAVLEAVPVAPWIAKKGVPVNFGKAVKFVVGQKVHRRDSGKDWNTGYVTSLNPLLVTVAEDASAKGYKWDEVKELPDSSKAKASNPALRKALRH